MPDTIIERAQRATLLIGGLEGRRVRGRCRRARRVGEGRRQGRRKEAIAKGAPRHKDLTPELGSIRVEAREVTIREKKVARVKGKERVGTAYPVEGEVLVGVGAGFKEAPHNTSTQGTDKELNIKAASATLSIVLHKDSPGNMMSRGGASSKG